MKLSVVALSLWIWYQIRTSHSLRCRSREPMKQNEDMEWAVIQCIRRITQNGSQQNVTQYGHKRYEGRKEMWHMLGQGQQNNRVDISQEIESILSNMQDWGRPTRDVDNKRAKPEQGPFRGQNLELGQRPRGYPQRTSTNNADFGERGQNRRPDGGEDGEEDYYQTPRQDQRQRGRPNQQGNHYPGGQQFSHHNQYPHSPGQQSQYDRDSYYNNYNNKGPLFQANNFYNRQNHSGDSRLNYLDPCVIHCVFQEMKMMDEHGKLSQENMVNQMTRTIQDRELRQFLQDTIEDCFQEVDKNRDGSRGQHRETQMSFHNRQMAELCRETKMLAMCLEERGRQACEDWNEPMNDDGNRETNINENNRDRDSYGKPKEQKKGLKPPGRG